MGRGRCCGPGAGGCSHCWLRRDPEWFGHLGGIFLRWTRLEHRPQSLLEARRGFPKGSLSLETCTAALILPRETLWARVGFALRGCVPWLGRVEDVPVARDSASSPGASHQRVGREMNLKL